MPFPAAHKHLFYTEIAKLLEAGFGIREAAAAMLDTRLPSLQAELLREMDRDLEAGKSITEAFAKNNAVISDLERGIIGAGERGGRMGQAFQHLADYFGMLAIARRDALQSMVYPVVLLHLGMFVAVVPGALISGEKGFAGFMVQLAAALLVLYALCFAAWLGIKAILKSAEANPRVDAMLNRLPVVGKARRSMAMARFTKVYHTCLLAGLSMHETVASSAEASRSGRIRQAGRAMAESLKEGEALGPLFVSSGAFPAAFARSYATAEESGSLDKDLSRWSAVYQDEAARGSKAVSVAVPKILYGLVMAFVVWKILSFWGGYYAALDQMSE